MNRRDFVRVSTVGGVAMSASRLLAQATPSATAASTAPLATSATGSAAGVTVCIPTAVSAMAAPDFEKSLDDMRQHGLVNAVLPFIYTHNQDRSGIPLNRLRGGNFAIPHMEYYKDCNLTYDDMRATDYGDLDVLGRLIPAAKQRGMKVFPWILEENARPKIANWEQLYEVDYLGRRATAHPEGPCANNPYYRNYILGLMEDYTRSYDIGGVMFGTERQGALFNAMSFESNGGGDPTRVTCFCEYCVAKAKGQGIDPDQARQAFIELAKYVQSIRAARPTDGYFVTFFRMLLKHPVLLAWENFWVQSRNQLQSDIYHKIKSIKPELPVGWHLWQNDTFSPFRRAEMDFADFSAFSDFVRPALYNNCAGERMRTAAGGLHRSVFGDLPVEQGLDLIYHLQNIQEAPYDQVAAAGFSADYVMREVRRAVDNLAGTPVQVWPGIDIDVPVARTSSHCTPASVQAAVKAAFAGGAKGIILSRNYVEMKPENLAAAGDALRELGAT